MRRRCVRVNSNSQVPILDTEKEASNILTLGLRIYELTWGLAFCRGSPPVVWQIPIVGDLPLMVLFKLDPVALRDQRRRRYGLIYTHWFLGRRTLSVCSPEHVAKVLGGEGTLVQCKYSVTGSLCGSSISVFELVRHGRFRSGGPPACACSVKHQLLYSRACIWG